MTQDAAQLADGLTRFGARLRPGAPVGPATRLSGGASQETWAFTLGAERLILRRGPGGAETPGSGQAIGLAAEAQVIAAAGAAGAPAPQVIGVLEDGDGLGAGYVMARLEGETLARPILRDARFAAARAELARQCGAALAAIHATPPQGLPSLPAAPALTQLDLYEEVYHGYGRDRPILALGFAELRRRAPPDIAPALVHGDFRLGNLMVDETGLVAALDWELAHVGDPAADLGWICTPSWRFGELDHPVGGFGALEDLLAGYHAAGGSPAVTRERVRYWMMLGSLKWGVMCLTMAHVFESGADPSVERAAIGRRASEAELDLILMLKGAL